MTKPLHTVQREREGGRDRDRQRVLKTLPGPSYIRSEGGVV